MLTKTQPIYDCEKSWADNLTSGPQFSGEYPHPITCKAVNFLGYQAASPLGVPAGPLLDSRWTTCAARLGYDIVTYKTIRTKPYPGHPVPNVIFVDSQTEKVAIEAKAPDKTNRISITNSFGMPSMDEDYLRRDIAKARSQLAENQLLIVSIVGTPGNAPSVIEDFAACARIAKDSEAHIIEANFSCPNICSKEGALYSDPDNAARIASAIVAAAYPLPVMIKVGYYPDIVLMRQVFNALAKAGVHAVCGINSVSMHVVNAAGLPALGKGRESSGICGNMIRGQAMQFVRNARKIIDLDKLGMELAGCGGLMLPEHFNEMLSEGAQIVLTATGMMWNPYLAHEWKKANCGD